MSSLSKTILIGRVGRDPELKTTSNGNNLVGIPVATTETWRDANNDKQEKTEWHNVTFFGKQADVIAQYVNKGDLLYVEGRNQTDCYEKEGVKHYSTKIIGRDFKFLTPKSAQEKPQETLSQPQSHLPPKQSTQGHASRALPKYNPSDLNDIPF